MLRLCDCRGEELRGKAALYHGVAFDWGTPEDEVIKNEVVGGDLINRVRNEARVFLVV